MFCFRSRFGGDGSRAVASSEAGAGFGVSRYGPAHPEAASPPLLPAGPGAPRKWQALSPNAVGMCGGRPIAGSSPESRESPSGARPGRTTFLPVPLSSGERRLAPSPRLSRPGANPGQPAIPYCPEKPGASRGRPHWTKQTDQCATPVIIDTISLLVVSAVRLMPT